MSHRIRPVKGIGRSGGVVGSRTLGAPMQELSAVLDEVPRDVCDFLDLVRHLDAGREMLETVEVLEGVGRDGNVWPD
jgi:hypothetical protein